MFFFHWEHINIAREATENVDVHSRSKFACFCVLSKEQAKSVLKDR